MVAAGLVNVISPRTIGPSISRMNIVSSSVWRVLSFALNGIVFVFLGTQLPKAMQGTWDDASIDNGVLIGYILAAHVHLRRRCASCGCSPWSAYHSHRSPKGQRPGWRADVRSSLVMALGGPKGTITLAVVLTIPVTYLDPLRGVVAFPQRELIIFLACGVIVVTLLLATFVVPLLAPRKPPTDEDLRCDETQVSLEILRAVDGGAGRAPDAREPRGHADGHPLVQPAHRAHQEQQRHSGRAEHRPAAAARSIGSRTTC